MIVALIPPDPPLAGALGPEALAVAVILSALRAR
jgi:hypothetical protein